MSTRRTVNGQEADLYGTYFVAEDVPLNTEGENARVVVARDAVSRTNEEETPVAQDRPPVVEATDQVAMVELAARLGACGQARTPHERRYLLF